MTGGAPEGPRTGTAVDLPTRPLDAVRGNLSSLWPEENGAQPLGISADPPGHGVVCKGVL